VAGPALAGLVAAGPAGDGEAAVAARDALLVGELALPGDTELAGAVVLAADAASAGDAVLVREAVPAGEAAVAVNAAGCALTFRGWLAPGAAAEQPAAAARSAKASVATEAARQRRCRTVNLDSHSVTESRLLLDNDPCRQQVRNWYIWRDK
jgi:hypothetical protein